MLMHWRRELTDMFGGARVCDMKRGLRKWGFS